MNETGKTTAAQTLQSVRAIIADDSPVLAAGMTTGSITALGPGFSDLFVSATPEGLPGTDDYRFALEYIFEGYLLHYGISRLFDPAADDFSLLAGDYMYARGLDHVTERGDLVSIRLLSELINFCSVIHCEQLDAGLAADAWAITTLQVAAAASGASSSNDKVELPVQATDGTGLKQRLESGLERLLVTLPEHATTNIRDELCNIYNSFNRQRRQDGTG